MPGSSGFSPPESSPISSAAIGAHADSALRSVRVVLGVLGFFVVAAYRPLATSDSWVSQATTLVLIVLCVLALNLASLRLPDRQSWLVVMQALDVVAALGLAVVLDGPLGQESWVLLLVPVVSASVRLGATASFLSWGGGCLLYLTAEAMGIVHPIDAAAAYIRVPGVLLAVAITVGLLARWMREGWEIQNELTAKSVAREQRLAVIERTSLAVRDLDQNQALEVCANQIVALGFGAATVHGDDGEFAVAIGDAEIVSDSIDAKDLSTQHAVSTVWMDHGEHRANSVSIVEAQTGWVVTGWSREPADEDQAQALVTLVAHTSTAIEARSLVNRLRDAASKDALTGVANRRAFDLELHRASQGPGPLALAFIDLDHFKALNDTHGHLSGDKVLVTVARRLESVVGDQGFVARFGGDEFVVLLHGTTLDEAERVARNILAAADDPIALGPANVTIGLSVGLAGGETPLRPNDLLEAGDRAVYQSKAAGRAQFLTEMPPDSLAALATPLLPHSYL